MNNAPANQLSNDQIDAIAQAMPGGLDGFLKQWGWRQFARAVLERCGNSYVGVLPAASAEPLCWKLTPEQYAALLSYAKARIQAQQPVSGADGLPELPDIAPTDDWDAVLDDIRRYGDACYRAGFIAAAGHCENCNAAQDHELLGPAADGIRALLAERDVLRDALAGVLVDDLLPLLPAEYIAKVRAVLAQQDADPCPQCIPGAVCKKATCGRLQGAIKRSQQDASLDSRIAADVAAVVETLDDGEWAEHIAKTELGQRLERHITQLVGKQQSETYSAPDAVLSDEQITQAIQCLTSEVSMEGGQVVINNVNGCIRALERAVLQKVAAKQDADKVDAARYRAWRSMVLKEYPSTTYDHLSEFLPFGVPVYRYPTTDEWDAAIDAARKEAGQ